MKTRYKMAYHRSVARLTNLWRADIPSTACGRGRRIGRKERGVWPAVGLVCALMWLLAVSAPSAEPDLMVRLDTALQGVATFTYGKDASLLEQVEAMVVESAKNPVQREAVERRLLQTLGSDATRDAKEFICRQLFIIGTVRCVPQLEALLTDPELSHIARFVLGRMEVSAAAEALQRALKKTTGQLQAGIANTLGDLRFEPARQDITRLLRSTDAAVVQAAVTALGNIGGIDAVKALQAMRVRVSAPLDQRIDEALLACADRFLAEKRPPDAARICQSFYAPDQKKHLRMAALRGLVAARGQNAFVLLVEAMQSSDADLQASAISLVRTVQGQDTTKKLADLLPTLAPETQELLLSALSARGDRAAVSAVVAATRSEQEKVRIAALAALGNLGDASAVEVLARTAATAGGNEQQEARTSLLRLSGDDINPALLATLRTADPKTRGELIRALAGRRATSAVDDLLPYAKDDEAAVRREAINALGSLAGEPQLKVMVALAMQPKDPGDRAAVEEAIVAVFRRIADPASRAAPVLSALGQAPAEAKPSLLRLLAKAATPDALAAVRAALKDPNPDSRDAALRTLSDWPDPAPAEDLLQVARTVPDSAHKVLALRGYVRMAGQTGNPTKMYARAMQLAERTDDKKMVLSGLGTGSGTEALQLVEQYLKDPQLETEAGLAAVQIAGRLRQSDARRAREALENVLALVKDQGVRQKAQDIINEMDQYQGYILTWLGAGPYKEKGKESRAIFDMAFPPEKSDGEKVEWKPLTKGLGSWEINLEGVFGSQDHCAAYLKTRVWLSAAREARLELGSDDAIKVWLNGRLVHENYTHRSAAPRQDIAKVKLQEGWNELLLKVVNHEGGWTFGCRVRQPDGSALDGLKIEAE
jgi:HEAT repeat protein